MGRSPDSGPSAVTSLPPILHQGRAPLAFAALGADGDGATSGACPTHTVHLHDVAEDTLSSQRACTVNEDSYPATVCKGVCV